jgi:hypothetical protein
LICNGIGDPAAFPGRIQPVLWGLARRGKEGKGRPSFLKKRRKKLLLLWLGAWGSSEPNNQQFFASFFQKRRPFFLCHQQKALLPSQVGARSF